MERQHPQLACDLQGNTYPKISALLNVAAAQTNAEIVGADAEYQIAVYHIASRVDGDADISYGSRTGSTTTARFTEFLAENGGSNTGSPDNNCPLFVCPRNHSLVVTTSGAGALGGLIIYAKIK